MTQARDLGDAANKANFLDNVSSDIQTQVTANILPAGLILPFGNTTAPTGFLECRGQLLNRTHYARLFAAIGTVWNTGGEYNTEFRLPDLRGAFLRGTGSHGTQNMADGNDYAGQAVGSFQSDQNQSHTHVLLAGPGGGNKPTFDRMIGVTGNSMVTETAGGDEARPFNASILYCIKT